VLPKEILLVDNVIATRYVVIMPGKTKTFEIKAVEIGGHHTYFSRKSGDTIPIFPMFVLSCDFYLIL